jgi:hypothetical protein
MGRAQAIQDSDLIYSPREGEVRTDLTDWANYRYTSAARPSPRNIRSTITSYRAFFLHSYDR